MEEVCGFMVVRRPRFNFDREGRGVWSARLPALGDRFYSGVERMPWFDLEEKVLDDPASPVSEILRAVRAERRDADFAGIQAIPDLALALRALDASGDADAQANEIVAVRSPELARVVGTIETSAPLERLGLDPVCLGEWSLLFDGVFVLPDLFAELVPVVNAHGLFDDEEACRRCVAHYVELEREEKVEPLADTPRVFSAIEVLRVLMEPANSP